MVLHFSVPYGVRLGNGLWVGVWVQTFYFAMVGLGQSCGRLGWKNSTHGQQLWYVNVSPVFLDKAQYACIYMVAHRKIRRVKVKVDKMNMSYTNEKLRRLVYMKQVCRCVCRSIQVIMLCDTELGVKVQEYYKHFVNSSNIKGVFNVAAPHTFVR